MNGITFASVATGGAYGTASFSATASGTLPPTTTTLAGGAVWSTQNPLDNESLLYYFTVPYLGAHELSWPSFRYAYITWIVIGFVFVAWSVAHLLTRRKSNPAGVTIRKICMKQIAWGGKWSQPTPNGKPQSARKRIWVTPTIAQMLAMTVMLAAIFCLSYIGPDYLSPTTCTWGGTCAAAVSQGPPKSTFNAKRSIEINSEPSIPQPAARHIKPSVPRDLVFRQHEKRREGKWGNLNPDGWAPYNDPLLAGINYEIDKNWWVSSSRVGMIAYVLLPLSVTLALKMWPFAVFAVPMLINYGIDKTAVFHHWFGRVIWVLSTIHVGLWSKQLFLDFDPYGYPVFFAMWKYWRFNAGVVAYVALTLMVVLSLQPFRNRYYEIFYYSHCALIIAFLLGCALHYRYLDPYPFIALALWGTERITRLLFWFYTNGFTQGLWFTEKRSAKLNRIHHVPSSPAMEKGAAEKQYDSPYSPQPPHAFVDGALLSAESSRTMLDDQYDSASTIRSLYKPPMTNVDLNPALMQPVQDPPPGFALYQLLPGRNVRITLRTPRTIRWKTGQSVSLTVPSVAFWQGHPFTIASADDRTTHKEKSGRPGNTFSMLVQTRKGFTKSLWNKLVKERQSVGSALVRQQGGVYLRTQISLPYGSAARMNLDDQDSTLIVCGGTGVSFGMAVFEHVCHNMANHRGRNSRVRFVWILREHAHLTWIATAVRKCLDLCPPDRVQIDFYVTREDGTTATVDSPHIDSLLPPRPGFANEQRRGSGSSLASELSTNSPAEVGDVVGESVLDYVVFDGEDEAPNSEERNMSRQVEKEGKMRRAKSRKEKGGRKGFLGLGHKKEASSSSTINGHSYPPNLAYTSGDHTPDTQTPMKSEDPRSYFLNDTDHSPRPASPSSPAGSDSEFDYPQHGRKRESHQSEHSINNLISPSRNLAGSNEGAALDVYERDQQDLNIIAELARTGRPDLGRTIDEELRICQNKLLVACCGPLALNVKVRELVSKRMSSGKSSTAQMTFWSEDYEG